MLTNFRDTKYDQARLMTVTATSVSVKTFEFVNHASLSDEFCVLDHGKRYVIQVYFNICGLVT